MKKNRLDFCASAPLSFKRFSQRVLRLEWKNVTMSLLFSILAIAFSLGSSYTLKILVDDVLIGNKAEWLWPIQGVFILAVILGNSCRLLESSFALRVASSATGAIRKTMFGRLLTGRLSELEKINRGDFTSSLMYDAGAVMDYFSGSAIVIYSAVLHIVFSLGLMFYLSPLLTGLTLVIIPVMAVVFSAFDKKIAVGNNYLINERKKISSTIYQVLGGVISVRAIQTEELQRKKFDACVDSHLNCSRRLNLLYIFYGMATWMLIMVPYQAIMYGVGGSFYFETGAPTIGLMLTFANYANGLLGPLQTVANYRKSRAAVEESYNSLLKTLQIPDEKGGTKKLDVGSAASTKQGLALSWSSLSFSYEAQEDKNGETVAHTKTINYRDSRISANSICLLKGPSGSGKSTLLKILFGLYPYKQGKVMVNGSELADLDLADYRSYLSYVPQEPVLIKGSVRDNLKAVAPGASEIQLEKLLERLKLNTGNGRLANGLDTEVGELGQAVSVGQRQRLVIAQGLLRSSRLFIFDEPNSALDAGSSSELADIIRELKQEATIIISSHDMLFHDLADLVVEL